MITNIMGMGLVFILIFMIWIKTPLKFMFFLSLMKLTIFTFMGLSSGQSWFSLILSMIGIGGILVSMMLMVSLEPNIKEKKSKFLFFSILIFSMWMTHQFSVFQNWTEMKMMMNQLFNLSFLTALMAFYFFCFSKIIGQKKIPMRTNFCQQK